MLRSEQRAVIHVINRAPDHTTGGIGLLGRNEIVQPVRRRNSIIASRRIFPAPSANPPRMPALLPVAKPRFLPVQAPFGCWQFGIPSGMIDVVIQMTG